MQQRREIFLLCQPTYCQNDGCGGLTLSYIGPDVPGDVTVMVEAGAFRNDPVFYHFPEGLTSGTVLSSIEESGMTIDAANHGGVELGTRTFLYINDVSETLHTGCADAALMAPGAPPLDDPIGEPSDQWFVEELKQK